MQQCGSGWYAVPIPQSDATQDMRGVFAATSLMPPHPSPLGHSELIWLLPSASLLNSGLFPILKYVPPKQSHAPFQTHSLPSSGSFPPACPLCLGVSPASRKPAHLQLLTRHTPLRKAGCTCPGPSIRQHLIGMCHVDQVYSVQEDLGDLVYPDCKQKCLWAILANKLDEHFSTKATQPDTGKVHVDTATQPQRKAGKRAVRGRARR